MAEEEPLLFIECTRDDTPLAVLNELRAQFEHGTGLWGDLTGTLEVHFKDENSAGSAVKREWFALASDALVATEAGVQPSAEDETERGGGESAERGEQKLVERAALGRRR